MTRRLATALLVFLALFTAGQELTEAQRNEADATRGRTLNELVRQFPGIDVAKMIDFYEQNAPDMLYEWRRRCIFHPDTAQDYINSLAKKYTQILDMREKSPEFYQYNVEQLRMEMEIRKMSFAFMALQQEGKTEQAEDLKAKLEVILKYSFDKSQEMEEKNMRKLEAKLEELKSQIQKRAANRDMLIQQKLKLLTEGN